MSILNKIKTGMAPRAQRVVLFSPEGLGKSSLAAHFPDPLFLDVEDSTSQLDVRRIEAKDLPDLKALESAVAEIIKEKACKTLVIDTVDWTEEMAISEVVATEQAKNLEDIGGGFGKGYAILTNRFTILLSKLDNCISNGINVLLLAHTSITPFDPPDGAGKYDRYELKLSKDRKNGKGTASLIKEWADIVCFANWKTNVAEKGKGAATTFKGVGGRERIMHFNRAATHDAKNRHGLGDTEPWGKDAEEAAQVFRKAFMNVGAPWDKEVVMATAAKAVETLKVEAVKPAKAPGKSPAASVAANIIPTHQTHAQTEPVGNDPAATVETPVEDATPSTAPDAGVAPDAENTPLPVTASPSEAVGNESRSNTVTTAAPSSGPAVAVNAPGVTASRELPRSADPIEGIEQAEDEDPELAALVGPQEAVVNAYIRGKALVKVDQTYRSLSPVERGRILKNFNGFLKVAVAAAGKGGAA